MPNVLSISVFATLLCISGCSIPFNFKTQTTHGYVNVRPDAHMFWWLYYTSELIDNNFVKRSDYVNYPIIIWLQGGPGGSSTGFGNFQLIGPLDSNLNIRNTTWLQYANLLFIDNPVGTGYSYVTDDNAYATNNEIIAADLIMTLKQFLSDNKHFENTPLYVFSESYGGKMAVSFAKMLYKAIQYNYVKCNFKGIVLGDSWISPIDAVSSWPEYLKTFSLVDEKEFLHLNSKVEEIKQQLANNEFRLATKSWSRLENLISDYTFNVDFYNVMRHSLENNNEYFHLGPEFFLRELILDDNLDELMNNDMRKILSIPNNVVWGSQSGNVFEYLSEDFMKPVTDEVSYILNNLPIKVVVYNGQFDLIVNTLGTEKWINNLVYNDKASFYSSRKTSIQNRDKLLGIRKSGGNLTFYWAFEAGHMLAIDSPEMGIQIVLQTLNHKSP